MAHMLVKLNIESYAKWRPIFDGHESFRTAAGALSAQVFRSGDDPFQVFVLMEWDELERARQFAISDELKAAMEQSGMTGPPEISFMSEV